MGVILAEALYYHPPSQPSPERGRDLRTGFSPISCYIQTKLNLKIKCLPLSALRERGWIGTY